MNKLIAESLDLIRGSLLILLGLVASLIALALAVALSIDDGRLETAEIVLGVALLIGVAFGGWFFWSQMIRIAAFAKVAREWKPRFPAETPTFDTLVRPSGPPTISNEALRKASETVLEALQREALSEFLSERRPSLDDLSSIEGEWLDARPARLKMEP